MIYYNALKALAFLLSVFLMSSCENYLHNSKMKNEEDNFELIITDEEVYDRIDDLVGNLQSQPNPYLYHEIKNMLAEITPENLELATPNYFPEATSVRIENLLRTFQSIEEASQNVCITRLSDRLASLAAPESSFWDAANILLGTNSIKALSIRDAKALIKILENLQEPKQLEAFVEDLSEKKTINIKDLEKEIKTKK